MKGYQFLKQLGARLQIFEAIGRKATNFQGERLLIFKAIRRKATNFCSNYTEGIYFFHQYYLYNL